MFLVLVAGILLFFIVTVSVISEQYVFESKKLEPAFIGALVAASGTIFAGCIAYSAASENVRIANEARLDAVRDRDALVAKVAQESVETKKAELRAVQGLKATVDRLIHQFDGATLAGDATDYFQHMFDAEQYGLLNVRIRKSLPEELTVRAIDTLEPLEKLRNSVMREVDKLQNGEPKEIFDANRAEVNGVIKQRLEIMQQFSEELVSEIAGRK